MISLDDKKNCCGCGACVQTCPKKCIVMKEDEEGFLYPQIDLASCINCELCEKVCPIIQVKTNKTIGTNNDPNVYVAYCKDECVRMDSSSGGLFSAIANPILDAEGVVFGAALDDENTVQHVAICEKLDLEKLRGSKYVQSNTLQTFSEVKKYLTAGKVVLYTGTACQIAGLKSFLRKDYENLYTIDVLCHGVPSPKLWNRYLDEQKKSHGADVRRTFFRHKKYGWKTYAVSLEFTNDTAYVSIFNKDAYMQMFLQNICLRPSCHSCQFKNIHRPSDITLGDCWGIEKYMPDMDDNKGTSVVLVHTKKGQELLDSISDKLVIRNAELDQALPPTSDSRKSVVPHKNRKQFFDRLNQGASINELLRLSKSPFAVRVIQKCKSMVKKVLTKMGVRR